MQIEIENHYWDCIENIQDKPILTPPTVCQVIVNIFIHRLLNPAFFKNHYEKIQQNCLMILQVVMANLNLRIPYIFLRYFWQLFKDIFLIFWS